MISSIRFRNSGREGLAQFRHNGLPDTGEALGLVLLASGSLPSKPSGFSAAVMFLAPTLEVMMMMVFLKSTRRPESR